MKKLAILTVIIAFLSMAFIGCQNEQSPVAAGSSKALILQTAELGDFVWNDVNMDGIQDPDEAGIEGVTVSLYDFEENFVDSAVTDENGHYTFDGVEPGDYYLEFMLLEDYEFSPMDQGDNDTLDSDADPETGLTGTLTLEADMSYLDVDAGMYMPEDEGCTYGKGFWKNHTGMGPQEDLVTDLLPIWLGNDDGELSMAVETPEMAYALLQQHTYGEPSNGITKLYAHLLTAKLNIANGANDEDIADVIDEIDDFLADHDWESWDELSHEDRQMVNQWKGMLGNYNDGEIGPGHCGDDYTLDTTY
jgi:hypothetical protein